MSNLKLDIIYYKTSSDFEMEFNLSGCCRMRIFKDKIESRKELVTALARDVARSKIIVIVTDLFGEDCAIPTISRAIGLPLVSTDKEAFGINTEDEVLMPNTAVPLVTKTGIYGGCILESGPQSIIIVSNVRALRHEIMKSYVHNYIFDVSQLFAYQERMGQNASLTVKKVETPVASVPAEIEQTTEPTETFETTTTAESEPVVETNEVSIKAEPAVEEITENATEDIVPVENKPEEKSEPTAKENPDDDIIERAPRKQFIEPGINHTSNLEDILTDFDNKEKPRKKRKSKKATSIILLVLVILLLISFGVLAYFFVYLPAVGIENPILSDQGGFFANLIQNLS